MVFAVENKTTKKRRVNKTMTHDELANLVLKLSDRLDSIEVDFHERLRELEKVVFPPVAEEKEPKQ